MPALEKKLQISNGPVKMSIWLSQYLSKATYKVVKWKFMYSKCDHTHGTTYTSLERWRWDPKNKQTPASAITPLFLTSKSNPYSVCGYKTLNTCLRIMCHCWRAGSQCWFDLPPSFYTLRHSNSCHMMLCSHTAVCATTSSQLVCLFTQLPPAPNNTFPRWSYSSSVINN